MRAPVNLARIWSIAGSSYCSLSTESFRREKSTHRRIPFVCLGTTMMGAHQTIGLSTRFIMSISSSLSSSFLRCESKLTGTRQGENKAKGFASCCNLKVYSPDMRPSPLNKSLYSCLGELALTAFRRFMMPSESIALRPRKG